jgi:hypothetical protein
MRALGWPVLGALPAGVIVPAVLAVRRRPRALPSNLATSGASRLGLALTRWRSGDRAALESLLHELAGARAAAHGMRTSALCGLLSDQMALTAEESAELTLAGAIHILFGRFSEHGDYDCPSATAGSLQAARQYFTSLGPAATALAATEHRERWDGRGEPDGHAGEAVSTSGRIIAAACAFDAASTESLEKGIAALREGSASAFDPVVVGELIHLFREPWPLEKAA